MINLMFRVLLELKEGFYKMKGILKMKLINQIFHSFFKSVSLMILLMKLKMKLTLHIHFHIHSQDSKNI